MSRNILSAALAAFGALCIASLGPAPAMAQGYGSNGTAQVNPPGRAPLPGSNYRMPQFKGPPPQIPVGQPAGFLQANAGLAADNGKSWVELPPDPPRGSEPLFGVIAEARLGLLDHASSWIGSGKESGLLIAPEVMFVPPDFFRYIGSPMPTLGIQYNTGGDRNFYYGQLTWRFEFFDTFHLSLGFGGAYQDGDRGTNAPSDLRLGCDFLFREMAALGFTIAERHVIEVQVDHFSHAGWCGERNSGTESLGLTYGYRF